MKAHSTPLADLFVIEPTVFSDSRGYFFESFNEKKFEELTGALPHFVQDNQSLSSKDVVRGLHFQAPPFGQAKLVRVIRGAVLDVVVDIRKNSRTYGQHFSCELTDKNHLMMWIPEGFAHGFSSLQDDTVFIYKCTNYYNKASEGSVLWNDPSLKIDWKVKDPVVSEKDQQGILLKDFSSPF